MKTIKTTLLLAALALPVSASAGSGWFQTDGGAQQFLDPANWDGGDVNGVFPAGWTSGTTSAHSIRFTNDWSGTIRFYGDVVKEITFAGYNAAGTRGEARTIAITDDIVIQPALSQYTDSRITFDANVGFDLGGQTRTLFGNGVLGTKLRFNGPISNGNIVLDGDGAGMSLLGAAAVDGDVVLRPNTTLSADYSGSATMVKRAERLELERATFSVNAYKNPDTSTTGDFIVSGKNAASVSILNLTHNNNCLGTLQADSLAVRDGGALLILSADLGASSDAIAGNRFLLVKAPTLVGGIVPFVFDDTSTTLTYKGNNNLQAYGALRFTTYDTERGLHALDSTDMATVISDSEDVNLYVKQTTIAVNSESSVNAICIDAANWTDSASISGAATLHVKSGQILASSSNGGITIGVPIDFGDIQGSVMGMGWPHRAVNITKPFTGTGGLVLSKAMPTSYDMTQAPSSGAAGFVINGTDIVDEGSYTGDTYVQCIVDVNSTPFLPHGTRSGNTIVNGCLKFGEISLNGLYGTGAVRGTTLTVGEDGSDGDFAGKAYVTTLAVSGGTLTLSGSIEQGNASVAAGAAIGGGGSIAGNLAFAEGGLLAVSIVDNAAPCLTVSGEVTGSPAVAVSAEGRVRDDFSACILRAGSALQGTFTCAMKDYKLELRENDTELWLVKIPATLLIVVK